MLIKYCAPLLIMILALVYNVKTDNNADKVLIKSLMDYAPKIACSEESIKQCLVNQRSLNPKSIEVEAYRT